jgi:hypothetical protein
MTKLFRLGGEYGAKMETFTATSGRQSFDFDNKIQPSDNYFDDASKIV